MIHYCIRSFVSLEDVGNGKLPNRARGARSHLVCPSPGRGI